MTDITERVELDRSFGADPLPEQIAAIIRARIADGTYRTRVGSIISLADEFAVGRSTSHAALVMLSEAGEIRLEPGRGYFVAAPVEAGEVAHAG
jgi:DNA-binding GntR family transcriptional regulator